jgi:hypothetical protein
MKLPAHERLADAVPIADLFTAWRKRASGKGVGTFDGLSQGHLKKLQEGQGQMENSQQPQNSRNSLKRRHLAFGGR